MKDLEIISISEANRRHDLEHGHIQDFSQSAIRSSWNESRLALRKKLTDRKISQYSKKGWYTAEFKEARRELMARKKAKREGNFLKQADGRLIYTP